MNFQKGVKAIKFFEKIKIKRNLMKILINL